MAPLSNKERQAAFRARKKVQPFADKHFGGMHVATVDQFLDALKIEREALTAVFPDPNISGLDIRDTGAFQSQWWEETTRHMIQMTQDDSKREQLSEIETEVTKRLHQEGYFKGLPDYSRTFETYLEDAIREYVQPDVEKSLDQWVESLTDEEKETVIMSDGYWGDPEDLDHPIKASQYPLYQLIEEFKKLVGMP